MPDASVIASGGCLTTEQLARIHPSLRDSVTGTWIPDARHMSAKLMDAILAHCNRAVLPDIARLLLNEQEQPTTSTSQSLKVS